MVKKFKINRERKFSAHHILIGAANAALREAEKRNPGWFYKELMAITMASLALEALCNAFGERIIKDWKDFESLNPIAKLRLICEKMNIVIDKNKEPWVTAKWLYKFRNEIAHAKPELVIESYIMTEEEYDKREKDYPKSKLENKISLNNAKKSVESIINIKDILFDKIKRSDKEGLYSDSWSGSAKLMDSDG